MQSLNLTPELGRLLPIGVHVSYRGSRCNHTLFVFAVAAQLVREATSRSLTLLRWQSLLSLV
jgi:hypothetical protein